MVLKIAADDSPTSIVDEDVVLVREYNEESDKVAVEEMERLCEMAGQKGKQQPSLVTHLLGDPKCRIRHFPTHVMLVAVYGVEEEVVGVIRACVKNVTRGNLVFVKVAYILGLRVSPMHRRLGIGTKLVKHLEEWCKQKGAEYAYMATDCTNEASINLFTLKCSYQKFRTPTILVQPVHNHYKLIPSTVAIVRLPPRLAELIYRQIYADSEFFPEDIDAILASHLNLGTLMALPRKCLQKWDPRKSTSPPNCAFAILSVWNTKQVFKLQVKGVSKLTKACCMGSRLADSWLPWLRLPSFPNVFKQFGVYFMYGLHAHQGKQGLRLMEGLSNFVHNAARDDHGCAAVVAEVSQRDPVREAIPHWRKLSWSEDMWCIKKLTAEASLPSDWNNSPPSSPMIFVDPRDF